MGRPLIKRQMIRGLAALGILSLLQKLTAHRLRILCYHALAYHDEHLFCPSFFISPVRFRQRLQWLQDNSFTVLPLPHALALLRQNQLPEKAVVITFDDGLRSVYRFALPLLKEFSYPATIYISTDYVQKQTPVFRLFIHDLFWRTSKKEIDLRGLLIPQLSQADLSQPKEKEQTKWKIIRHGEKNLSEDERQFLTKKLQFLLDVPLHPFPNDYLALMNEQEIKDAHAQGFTIALHTHNHFFPEDSLLATAQILENQKILQNITGEKSTHFCYPSGVWHPSHFSSLEKTGVESATTLIYGINGPKTPKYLLRRVMDRHDLNDSEFDAEMKGLGVFLRWFKFY